MYIYIYVYIYQYKHNLKSGHIHLATKLMKAPQTHTTMTSPQFHHSTLSHLGRVVLPDLFTLDVGAAKVECQTFDSINNQRKINICTSNLLDHIEQENKTITNMQRELVKLASTCEERNHYMSQ